MIFFYLLRTRARPPVSHPLHTRPTQKRVRGPKAPALSPRPGPAAPRFRIYVSSYLYMCPRASTYVLVPLYMCPHTSICVLVRLYVCHHTSVYVSSYLTYRLCPHTLYICPQTSIYVSSYLYMSPHTSIVIPHASMCLHTYVSSYLYTCALIPLYMCPHTTTPLYTRQSPSNWVLDVGKRASVSHKSPALVHSNDRCSYLYITTGSHTSYLYAFK